MALTNDQVEQLMNREKRITQTLSWKPREDRAGYELDVSVGFHDPDTGIWELGRLVAIAVPGKRARCTLMYGNVPIRRLCDASRHKNPAPDNTEFEGFHKHRWDETDNQRWAYLPEDLDTSRYVESPDAAVLDFLKECSIELVASHQPLLI